MIDTVSAAVPRRHEIPEEFTWDFTIMYADDQDWEEDLARIEAMIPEVELLQGTTGRDAEGLLRVLEMKDRVSMQMSRLYIYARMRKDIDGTDSSGQALDTRAASLNARISAALSFVEPETLAIPPEDLARWQTETPKLAPYVYYLDLLSRQRDHVRSSEVESVIAQFSDVTRAAGDTYDVLTNADLVFPTIEDEHGQPLQLSQGRYGSLLESPDRRVRRDTFKGVLGTFAGVRRTLATTLAATARNDALAARLRNYPSALAAALAPNDIPVEVYHNLLTTVNANLSSLHRYVSLRKRILGLDAVHGYDLRAPLVADARDSFDYATASAMMHDAFTPMGPEYGAAVRQVLTSRWVDVYENMGKASGAYSDGAYSTPPFILLNYQDRLDDAYTLAHELGHSLHSYYTRRTQPYVSGNYTLFLAEVASTLNEALLTEHLLHTVDDTALRQQLLVMQIEGLRTTFFRQTMFAEFELDLHQQTEAGEALTAESLSERYGELVARYHGPDLAIDEELTCEWAYIPHFYYNFYVYQYATGISAALALSRQILAEGEPAVQRYLHFLQSGSSRSSIDLLRQAGVDMTSPQPVQAAIDHFDALVDELDALMV